MCAGAAFAFTPATAGAADARHQFTIPSRLYADALTILGTQAKVSILGTTSCGPGFAPRLVGRLSLSLALERMLDGAPCRYRMADARTVLIMAAPVREKVAPTESARPPLSVDEVIVTATKQPEFAGRLPLSVSVVSSTQLAATGAVDTGGAAGQFAGLLTTNLGPGRDKFLVRGLSDSAFTGRARSTVSTYLDDVPINFSAPDPDLRLVDVERLELLRGPQGALYGSGSIAGIYRIVTRRADPQAFAAGLGAGVATPRGGSLSSEFEGYLNLPVMPEHAAIRMVAYHDVQGGYLDNSALDQTNLDKTTRTGGRLAAAVILPGDWRLDFTASVQHLRTSDTQYLVTLPNAVGSARANAAQRTNHFREPHQNDFSHAALDMAGHMGGASVSSTIAYIHHRFTSQFDAPEAASVFGGRPSAQAAYVESSQVGVLVGDFRVRSANADRFGWLAGVYAAQRLERSPALLTIFDNGAVTTPYRERRKDRQSDIALYGEVRYDLDPDWTLTVGLRQFLSTVRTTSDLTIAWPSAPRSVGGSQAFNGVLPTVALKRDFGPNALVYALYSEAHRPGGLNTGGVFPIRTDPDRTRFASDRLRNYEVGAKIRDPNGRFTLDSAIYYDEWSAIQAERYRPSGIAYTTNLGDAEVIGLEAELTYAWSSHLVAKANGLVTYGRLNNLNPDVPVSALRSLPAAPRASGGLLLIYKLPLPGEPDVRLISEVNYVGASRISFESKAPEDMDAYLRLGLTAEIATPRWTAAVYIRNPLNSSGDTFSYGNPFSFSGDNRKHQSTPQRPRTVGIRLSTTL